MMKIRTALMTVALVAMLVLTACAVKDKVMESTEVMVNGNAAEYVKVVEGPSTLMQVDGGLELTLKAKLLKELVGVDRDSLQVGNWYLTFKNTEGITVIGMESMPLKEEQKPLVIDLMKGPVGEETNLTFMQMIDNKDEVKRILKKAASFELTTEIKYKEAMIPVVEVPVIPPVAGTPPVVKPPVKPPVVTPPTPPAPTVSDAKINEFSTAVDRYVILRDKKPTTPREQTRLSQLRTEAQTLQNNLTAVYDDMTGAQKTRFNNIKAKM